MNSQPWLRRTRNSVELIIQFTATVNLGCRIATIMFGTSKITLCSKDVLHNVYNVLFRSDSDLLRMRRAGARTGGKIHLRNLGQLVPKNTCHKMQPPQGVINDL